MERVNRRRFLQFSLNALLLCQLLCGFGVWLYQYGYVNYGLPQTRQREAGVALEQRGARVKWEPSKPAWLRSALGLFIDAETLQDCISVDAQKIGLTDPDLKHFQHMPRLRELNLSVNPIEGEGLKHLRGLQRLELLNLYDTAIDDDKHLRHLKDLSELRHLNIHGGPEHRDRVTHACLEHLRHLPQLRTLEQSFSMNDTTLAALAKMPKLEIRKLRLDVVSDAGMAELPRFSQLEELRIGRAFIEKDGLKYLAQLPNLRKLALSDVSTLYDEDRLCRLPAAHRMPPPEANVDQWQYLSELTNLKELRLTGSSIRDSEVRHLANLTNLELLSLYLTPVTADCLRHLRSLKKLKELQFQFPLDDEAVGWLTELPNLQHCRYEPRYWCAAGEPPYRSEFHLYLTDSGLKHLARLPCLDGFYLYDARLGAGLKGVDVPEGAGTITDAGLFHLVNEKPNAGFQVWGRDITTPDPNSKPRHHSNRFRIRKSPRPASNSKELSSEWSVTGGEIEVFNNRLDMMAKVHPNHSIYFKDGTFDLRLLRFLPEIRRLEIKPHVRGNVFDDAWNHLPINHELMDLAIHEEYELNASAIRRIGELTSLRELSCSLQQNVTPEDLTPLLQLGNLNQLHIGRGPLGNEHFETLSKLKNLEWFTVRVGPRAVVEERTLRHLAKFTNLTGLTVDNCSDKVIQNLIECKNLTRLALSGRGTTDEGLRHLEKLSGLTHVIARDSRISKNGIERFREKRPGVTLWVIGDSVRQ